jgi:8-amino-7-oxononanoate synthase
MDGDLAPLVDLAELAEHFDAMLIVDEAHATGVFGDAGRGVCEHLGVEGGVHVRVGTLSKALGSIGGFVVGTNRLVQWLANRARTYVYSTAPPEAMAAAGLRSLQIVRTEPQRRQTLLERADTLRATLQDKGWFCGDSTSQIIPVRIGDVRQTIEMAATLRDRGMFVPGIRPPTVPAGESLLRISLSYSHSEESLHQLADTLRALR